MDAEFKKFHIPYGKKRPLFRFLDPPYFWAEGPNIFFGNFTKIFAEKNNRFGPPGP